VVEVNSGALGVRRWLLATGDEEVVWTEAGGGFGELGADTAEDGGDAGMEGEDEKCFEIKFDSRAEALGRQF